MPLTITSPAFRNGEVIPVRYTRDGESLSPPLEWRDAPPETKSYVLIVEDPDAPSLHPLVHAIVWNIGPDERALAEGGICEAGESGRNSYRMTGWMPPDPPPGHGPHHYAFQLFALDSTPDFSATPGREEVLEQLRAYAIASGLLIGTCERPDGTIKIEETAPGGPAVAG